MAHHGMVGSMGKVGSAGDNAATESLFALLQKNMLNRRRRWATCDQLRIGARDLDRTHLPPATPPSARGGLTPLEYETIIAPQTAYAA